MKLWEKQAIFAYNIGLLIQNIRDYGYACTLGEAYRTPEQAALYAKQGKGIYNSLHCQRLAIDLNLFSDKGIYLTQSDDYKPFGIFWESLHPHNRWGGTFARADGNHFEMRLVKEK